MSVKVKCLYTEQKNKKRKTWKDGFLTINRNLSKVDLYRTDGSAVHLENNIATRFMSALEIGKLFQSEDVETTIEFENFVATFESVQGCKTRKRQDNLPPVPASSEDLKPKRFKPPSKVVKHEMASYGELEERKLSNGTNNRTYAPPTGNSFYSVTESELNEIWGSESKEISIPRSPNISQNDDPVDRNIWGDINDYDCRKSAHDVKLKQENLSYLKEKNRALLGEMCTYSGALRDIDAAAKVGYSAFATHKEDSTPSEFLYDNCTNNEDQHISLDVDDSGDDGGRYLSGGVATHPTDLDVKPSYTDHTKQQDGSRRSMQTIGATMDIRNKDDEKKVYNYAASGRGAPMCPDISIWF